MTEDVLARLVRNVVALERIANTIALESEARIQALYRAIVDDLRLIDPTAPIQPTYRRLRTEEFLREVRGHLRNFATAEQRALKDSLSVVGRAQAKQAEITLKATLGDVGASRVRITPITQQRLRAILNTDPFQGRILSEHVNQLSANAYVRVRDQIRMGMVAEEGIPDLVRRIRGSQAGYIRQDPDTGAFVPRGTPGARVTPRYVGGVVSSTTREAEALVRTAVNHVSNVGMRETFEENKTILAGVRYVATLDDRTTEVCLSLDGKVWPADSDEIQQPPLHYNCRSVLVPEVDWDKLGLEPPPDLTRAARDLSDVSEEDLARRVSARRRTGDLGRSVQIPSRVQAEEWLRGQPVRVQEKLLGVGKAKLFRDGKISLADLIRQDMSTVSLAELETA